MSFLSWMYNFLYSQYLITPPFPTKPFTEQTVIVTGSNTGLGREAARHIVRLGAEKVILAVRTQSKGETAKRSIEESTGREGVVEVWSLDLSSYESVREFAARAERELRRVDVLLENAGMMMSRFEVTEGDEATVTTNVVSTFLLGVLMLPKLRETALRFNVRPRVTVVSSDLHFLCKFPEREEEEIFKALAERGRANMSDRYGTTKLLEVLLVRQMHSLLGPSSPIVVNSLTPGACASDFFRNEVGIVSRAFMAIMLRVLARTTEVGSRTLVLAASASEETAGRYMADGVVANESPFVRSEEGKAVGERVWKELMVKLDEVSPGIEGNVLS